MARQAQGDRNCEIEVWARAMPASATALIDRVSDIRKSYCQVTAERGIVSRAGRVLLRLKTRTANN